MNGSKNLTRMIKLAEEFFGARTDPSQISVSSREMEKLKKIHPSTLTERRTRGGPVAWMLLVPTTKRLMTKFIRREITEKELLKKTPVGKKYDAVYLCSALVLPEYRRKGIAKRLMLKAVKSIARDNPINALFYWEFSASGKKVADAVAKACNIPLYRRH
jgi:ribosomal protein S18 acetylase RimI-like enzyme